MKKQFLYIILVILLLSCKKEELPIRVSVILAIGILSIIILKSETRLV